MPDTVMQGGKPVLVTKDLGDVEEPRVSIVSVWRSQSIISAWAKSVQWES